MSPKTRINIQIQMIHRKNQSISQKKSKNCIASLSSI